jgi:hypothetical protein
MDKEAVIAWPGGVAPGGRAEAVAGLDAATDPRTLDREDLEAAFLALRAELERVEAERDHLRLEIATWPLPALLD